MTRAVGQGPLGPSGAPRGGGALRLAMLHPYRLRTSGSGVYLVRVARELLRHGHHVTLLSHDDDADQALGEPAGAAAAQGRWRARSLRGVGTPVAYPRAEESRVLFRDLPDAGLRRYLDHHVEEATRAARGVDVVHVNGEVPLSFVAAEVRRRTGTPYVTVAHGSTLEYVARVDERFAGLARTGLSEAAAVVALNAEVRARVLQFAPDARVVTVPCGVDTTAIVPGQLRPDRPPTLAYVGRLSIDKGVLHLLGAVPRLAELVPGVRVVVVGDGVCTGVLQEVMSQLRAGRTEAVTRLVWSHADPSERTWAADLVESWRRDPPPAGTDFDVVFRGRLDERGVADTLADCDMVAVPSLVHEAFPLVVLEALAAGVPPMATDAGGLSAVLDEITPELGDAGALLRLPAPSEGLAHDLPLRAARLLRHARGPSGGDLRHRCRRLAEERYSWPVVVRKLEDVYARVSRQEVQG